MLRTHAPLGLSLSAALLTLVTLRGAAGFAPQPAASIARASTTIDSTLLRSYRWRSVGPDRGGRSIAVSGVKGRPDEAYFGATGGGLWKTVDGGDRWFPVT